MATRLELQTFLEDILGSGNVYYQPPETLRMSYPAIVYSLSRINNTFANDSVYRQKRAYKISVIDEDPESLIAEEFSRLPLCTFDTSYPKDNLNHTVFTLYF